MGSGRNELPAAKRLRLDDADSSASRGGSESDPEDAEGRLAYAPDTPIRQETETKDNDDSKELPTSQTELETSLPSVSTEEEAIHEYEKSSGVGGDNGEYRTNLEKRLGDRSWQKGRSSIYVDAFNLALDTVLDEESHLFDEAELAVFEQWKGLVYESQYLYVFASC